MKKALRTLVPLLLAVAVLLSMAWYLLIYDREFTKEMILWTARTLCELRRHRKECFPKRHLYHRSRSRY